MGMNPFLKLLTTMLASIVFLVFAAFSLIFACVSELIVSFFNAKN
jgi:hypothetical protein